METISDAVNGLSRCSIEIGKAVVPFCERKNAWVLPAGPQQKQRFVRDFETAYTFALRLNKILSGKASEAAV